MRLSKSAPLIRSTLSPNGQWPSVFPMWGSLRDSAAEEIFLHEIKNPWRRKLTTVDLLWYMSPNSLGQIHSFLALRFP